VRFSVLDGERIIYSREQLLTEESQLYLDLSYGRLSSLNDDLVGFEFLGDKFIKQILQSIQQFLAASGGRRIDRMILAGNHDVLISIKQLLEATLAVPVHIANPFVKMELSGKVNLEKLNVVAPSMMVACGLAIRGLEV